MTASLHLILVDDDQDIRRAVTRLLRSHGHDVEAFDSAEAYLAARGPADCAILDLELPGLGGLELGRQMREDGCGIPLVFITGHQALAGLAIERLSSPCLMKPLDEHGLLDAIERARIDRR